MCCSPRCGWMSLRRYFTGTVPEWIHVTLATFLVISGSYFRISSSFKPFCCTLNALSCLLFRKKCGFIRNFPVPIIIKHQFSPTDHLSISGRLNLRSRLQCKSFKWYLDTVYPDLFVPSLEYFGRGAVSLSVRLSVIIVV